MYARECQILWTEASKRGSTIDSCDNGWFWQWVVETIEKVTFVFLMLYTTMWPCLSNLTEAQ